MKRFRNILLCIVSIFWLTVLIQFMSARMHQQHALNRSQLLPYLVGLVIFACVALGFISYLLFLGYKSQKGTFREFLNGQIEFMDEDERTLQLSNKVATWVNTHIIAAVIIIIFIFSTRRQMLSILDVLLLITLLGSLYCLLLYFGMKRAYNTDMIPKFLQRTYVLPFIIAATTLLLFSVLSPLQWPQAPSEEPRVVVVMHVNDDGFTYEIPRQATASSLDTQTILVRDLMDGLLHSKDDPNALYLIYNGTLDAFNEAFSRATNQGTLSSFYGNLRIARLSYIDQRNLTAILSIEP